MKASEYQLLYSQEDDYWWFVVKRMFIETILQLLPPKANRQILDVGCGTGRNLELLAQYGRAEGVDASPIAVQFCKQRGLNQVRQAKAQMLDFPANRFDLITLFDVLYHKGIESDDEVLTKVHSILKKDGYILITDCAIPWLFGPHDMDHHARQRYWLSELKNKLENTGYTVRKASYTFWFTFPLFAIERLASKYLGYRINSGYKPLPTWVNHFLIQIGIWENKWLQSYSLPWGSSLIILAQK